MPTVILPLGGVLADRREVPILHTYFSPVIALAKFATE